jgi:hypothetical protein
MPGQGERKCQGRLAQGGFGIESRRLARERQRLLGTAAMQRRVPVEGHDAHQREGGPGEGRGEGRVDPRRPQEHRARGDGVLLGAALVQFAPE